VKAAAAGGCKGAAAAAAAFGGGWHSSAAQSSSPKVRGSAARAKSIVDSNGSNTHNIQVFKPV
jgi:hypothetical protein